jgi:hypothetical protein
MRALRRTLRILKVVRGINDKLSRIIWYNPDLVGLGHLCCSDTDPEPDTTFRHENVRLHLKIVNFCVDQLKKNTACKSPAGALVRISFLLLLLFLVSGTISKVGIRNKSLGTRETAKMLASPAIVTYLNRPSGCLNRPRSRPSFTPNFVNNSPPPPPPPPL